MKDRTGVYAVIAMIAIVLIVAFVVVQENKISGEAYRNTIVQKEFGLQYPHMDRVAPASAVNQDLVKLRTEMNRGYYVYG